MSTDRHALQASASTFKEWIVRASSALAVLLFALMVAVMVPRNLTIYAAFPLLLTATYWTVTGRTKGFKWTAAIFLLVSLSPIDVDTHAGSGEIRLLPIRMGTYHEAVNGFWYGGCIVGLYDPKWMLTRRN